MEFKQDTFFIYSCYLVKISRKLSPEQVKQFKNWLIAKSLYYEIYFSESQLSEMDKYTILNIFDILKKQDLLDPWQDPILVDFLKENNLEHLLAYKQNNHSKKMDFPSPVDPMCPNNENIHFARAQFSEYNNYYRQSTLNPEFTFQPPPPPSHSSTPYEFNFQKQVFANENNYRAEVNGGAMTINNLTYNGPIQVINTGNTTPESKSPVDEPEEVNSPISPEFIDVIASEIGREWKTVARKGFKLEEGKIDEIEYDSRRLKDQVVRMITLWKSLSEDCSLLAFARALCKSNLRGIVKGNFPVAVSRVALK
ncbi:hypothetical protein LOD99_13528 [Oopsacas minuta]|uniref:Death domain-containing protein n=1 Tax=Oopsacas minuta TaxID=111878 RepID=A0AAV7KL44_9METZ|nr:hypothetical protein LOD99_13528 [Oopsacas minuta]